MIPLCDPVDGSLLIRQHDVLVSPAGSVYPIVDEIPRFTGQADAGQAQTANSFGYKWARGSEWGFKPEHQDVLWTFWRDVLGWNGPDDLKAFMAGKTVLDAGCGAGLSLRQFVDWPSEIVATDISDAVDVCREHFRDRPNVTFVQADLRMLPFPSDAFDIVWSNGVLHHTPDVFDSLRALVRHLKPEGLIFFYIYVKKAPIREFVDDHFRQEILGLPPEDAWQRCEALTKLARRLSEYEQPLVVDEDIPELGITRGTYNLQRFLYQHVFKCYWNSQLSLEDNVHVNFDWYHPTYAHRHTVAEVRKWLPLLGLTEQSLRESQSGMAVMAQKA